jgi:hypothetical protein
MAYVSQELKARLSPAIKAVCKKYGVKASIAVSNHSTLVLNISQGKIDFITDYNTATSNRPGGFRNGTPAKDSIQVNTYWYKEHFDGESYHFLNEVIPLMNDGNYDKSDAQVDYFNVGWYIDVNIGRWNKPYQLVK